MSSFLISLNPFLFVIWPYVTLAVFFLGSIHRYISQPFSYSSLSSQFLENRSHFWGMVPFHYGIILLFVGHLIAFIIPKGVLLWNRVPARLYVLEITALTLGILTLIGLINLIFRRMGNAKLKVVTTKADWMVLFLLLVQVLIGVYLAIFHRWGSSWFAASLAPYLWSLLKLNPDFSYLVGLPFMIKLHIIIAFTILGMFPFTRLVHLLVVPNPYLWRRIQVVRWYHKLRSDSGRERRRMPDMS